jgi:NADH-quinone oxidoreductase subunit J
MASDALLFYAFAAASVIGALLVVAQRNPVYSLVSLVGSFFGLCGLYVLLEAPFVAVVQIIVYAGAIMVLFLFVVMLLNAPHEDTEYDERVHPLLRPGPMKFGAALALLLIAELWWALGRSGDSGSFPAGAVTSVGAIGRSLFTDYAFAFEVTSILILVAMVGAVVLARRDPAEKRISPLAIPEELEEEARVASSFGAGGPAPTENRP